MVHVKRGIYDLGEERRWRGSGEAVEVEMAPKGAEDRKNVLGSSVGRKVIRSPPGL